MLVCDEIYLPVHHCLLGHIPKDQHTSKTVVDPQGTPQPTEARVKPLHDLKNIKKLYSHPQAWGQCKLFLNTHLKKVERQDVSSTSKAAEYVAQDTTGTSAAISSRLAADLNGLDVLAEGIEDNKENSTRFFVLRHRSGADFAQNQTDVMENVEMERYKTLVSFTVSHSEPGALADSLAVFKKYKLNLTSINTRPSGEAQWHYIFFVEFMGRKCEDGEGGAVNDALAELGKVARSCRWLGSWEDALKG